MLETIIIAIALVLAGFLAFVARRPDTFRVERSLAMNASPGALFALLNDFHNWPSWSPFEKLDPDIKRSYSGAGSGRGAVYEWQGNARAGAGRMEVLEAEAPSRVVIKLDFIKPFEGHNIAEFTILESGGTTTTTWAMHGPVPFLAKLMHLFVSMDAIIGKEFEAGLENLKNATER
jgi:hypothetical protein